MLKNKTLTFFIILIFCFNFHVLVLGEEAEADKAKAQQDDNASGQFVYEAKGKRNPFMPLVTRDGRMLKTELTEEGKDLILEGIIYDKNGLSYAMVNGQAVKIGDSVNDYQVLKIEPNKVVFIKDGETLDLILKKEE